MKRVIAICVVVLLVGLGAFVFIAKKQDASSANVLPTTLPRHVSQVPSPQLPSQPRPDQPPLNHQEPTLETPEVISVLQTHFATESEHMRAILTSLVSSGPATQELQTSGERFATSLQKRGLATADWNCYHAGCYYHLLAGADQDRVVGAREDATAAHPLIITADSTPNKLVIMLDGK